MNARRLAAVPLEGRGSRYNYLGDRLPWSSALVLGGAFVLAGERACYGVGIMERFLFPTKERLVNCCSGTRRNEEFYHARDGYLNAEGAAPVAALAVPGIAILPR